VRQSTIITFGASVAFGVFAVILARGWIDDAIRDEYSKRSHPVESTSVTATQMDLVPVVVMSADVGFGDSLSPDLMRVVEYPADAVPEGTYESLNNIFIEPGSPTIVLRRMARNEAVLDYKISGPGARGSLSALISDGMRAVSVRVSDVSGVSGFVMPGDYVDVLYTRDEESRRNGNNLKSDVLLQNVKVLGIDQDLDDRNDIPVVVKTVTLEVANIDAQKLHLAQDAGKLSLTLRRAGDTSVDKTKTVEQTSILSAPRTTIRYKYPARTPIARTTTKPSSRLADVTIIRGDERDQVQVLKDPDTIDQSKKLAGG